MICCLVKLLKKISESPGGQTIKEKNLIFVIANYHLEYVLWCLINAQQGFRESCSYVSYDGISLSIIMIFFQKIYHKLHNAFFIFITLVQESVI